MRWRLGELGDEVVLASGPGWVRRCRIVGVTDTGPHTREYRIREVDDGHKVFHAEGHEDGPRQDDDREDCEGADRVVGDEVGHHHGDRRVVEEDPQEHVAGGCDGAQGQGGVGCEADDQQDGGEEGCVGRRVEGRQPAGWPRSERLLLDPDPFGHPGWDALLAEGNLNGEEL